ncbi:VOC family protein [Propylenella binzhouense]|uniref:VOC family protein n=1 Tax=Propylenella binzhouense TaxID=2555902 RepID=A0A964T4T8_9HYPH|nr:VOC family protein [Propylenella binzhouense]MYZ47517.1 VOC family protein [Propylenella binzhouense]
MDGHGRFCWNELMTRDVEGVKAFYAAALGWRYDGMPMPDGTYWVIMGDGPKPIGGILDISAPVWEGVPACWFAYVAVDDVDARVAAAERLGATIHKAPFDIPGVGRIAIVGQPDGAAIGWMTPVPELGN